MSRRTMLGAAMRARDRGGGARAGGCRADDPRCSSAVDLSAVVGAGEGELNLIIWAGYAEDGAQPAEYDWVNPFEEATGCQVNVKIGRHAPTRWSRSCAPAQYDGVSASGDASLRLIAAGDVAAINHDLDPGLLGRLRGSSRTRRTTSSTASTTACPTAGAATC